MLTRGEWELKHIGINSTNQTIANKSRVSFKVRWYLGWDFSNSSFTDSHICLSLMTLFSQVSMLRKPMLYVIDFIIPLFYFLIMDLASFFISEARGEKLSFKVTILLSISVLLLLLADILPSTEKDMPILCEDSDKTFYLHYVVYIFFPHIYIVALSVLLNQRSAKLFFIVCATVTIKILFLILSFFVTDFCKIALTRNLSASHF